MSRLSFASRCVALTGLALAVAACGDSGDTGSAPPLPPTATPQPVPPSPSAAPVQEPSPAAPAASGGVPDASRGKPLYAQYCTSCHGEKGCGDGPLSATLNPKPAKHCDGTLMNPLADDFLFKVVKEGGAAVGKSPLMAPWGGTLTDGQIHDVVAFVRTLADPPYKPHG